MRFAFVSPALLALALSLTPGVHAAPAVLSDRTNTLAVRQDPASALTALVGSIVGAVQSLLGNAALTPSQLAEQLAQIAQEIQNSAASGVLPRAPFSSDSIPSASPTSFTIPTTTSLVSVVATDQMGASTTSSVSGVSVSAPSSTQATRMRRQLPSALPTSVLSAVLSIVSSGSASLPVPSVAASALSAVLSQLGSVPSQSAASKPTPSNPLA